MRIRDWSSDVCSSDLAQYANLEFEFVSSANAQVRIAFNDDGAWSYVGTDALGIPANQPTMNFGWLDQGVVQHEFGHMIGMIHEHQNPRDNPIQWDKRSEEHTSELQSLMRISYAVFCLKKKNILQNQQY